MQTVTKRELVQRIAEKTGVQQISAKEVIQSFLDEIINELAKGNRLEFRDFGVFEPKSKAHRVARNPRTGAKVEVPEKTTVKFKVGRLMKKKIQGEDTSEEPGADEGEDATNPPATARSSGSPPVQGMRSPPGEARV
jgi:integration host factor subunit beta